MNERLPGRYRPNTNPFGLNDNCYYATLAGILNADLHSLIGVTEIMQNNGGAQWDEIIEILRSVKNQVGGLHGLNFLRPFQTPSLHLLELNINIAFGSKNYNRVALGYTRPNGSRHMIAVLPPESFAGLFRCVDYQISREDLAVYFDIWNALSYEYMFIKVPETQFASVDIITQGIGALSLGSDNDMDVDYI